MTAPALQTPAFDYSAQRWVTGPGAIPIRRAQINEELTLLRSNRGSAFCRFSGISDKHAAIAKLEGQLAGLT